MPVIGRGFPSRPRIGHPRPPARVLRQFFSGQADGASMTAGTTAAGGDPAGLIQIAAGGFAAYTTDNPYRGTSSGRLSAQATAGQTYFEWGTGGVGLGGTASNTQHYVRLRVRFPIMPPDATGIPFLIITDGVGAFQIDCRMNSSGQILLRSGTGTVLGTSTATYSTSSWVDVGAAIKVYGGAGVGQLELVLYNSSGTITETLSGSADTIRGGGLNRLQVGQVRSLAFQTVDINEVAWATDAYPSLPVTAVSVTVTPGTVAGTAGVGAATAVTSTNATATPTTVAGVGAVGDSTETAAAVVTPGTVGAVTSAGTPTVVTASASTATPAAVTGVAAVAAPAVSTGSRVTAVAVVAVAAVGAAAARIGVAATPATVTGLAAVPAPTVDAVPPTVPTNLTVTATTEGTLDLSWTASTDNSGLVTDYEVRILPGPAVDPRGTPFTLTTASLPLKGAQIGAWDMNGGLLTANSGARTLTQQAGTKLVRWQMWRTPCDIRGTACQTTSDFLTGLDTCRKLAAGNNALLMIGLPPIWNEQYPGQPDPWSYAWQQFVVDKTLTFLGPAAAADVIFEMGNEPDNYGGLTGQQYYDQLWAPNVPALKAYARYTYGVDIRIGGPSWANSYTADLTSIGTWMTACKNGYTANGNNRDYIPDFVSTHTYLTTPAENDTLANMFTRIDSWGVFFRQLKTNINTTFAGLSDRGYPIARQIKTVNSEYNYTIVNSNTQDSDQGFMDHYMRAMHAMFEASGLWASVEFTVASHTGGALDLLTAGGAAKPLYYSYAAQ